MSQKYVDTEHIIKMFLLDQIFHLSVQHSVSLKTVTFQHPQHLVMVRERLSSDIGEKYHRDSRPNHNLSLTLTKMLLLPKPNRMLELIHHNHLFAAAFSLINVALY